MTTAAWTGMATAPATMKTTTAPATCQSLSRCGSSANVKPSWLLAALADLEEKYQSIAVDVYRDEAPDSFAERAENYYRKRPQLFSLLHDLYHRYISLADRYSQTLLKPLRKGHRRTSSQASSTLHSDLDDGDGEALRAMDSDAESSLSFQCPTVPPPAICVDELLAELVVRTVENEILQHEISSVDKYHCESLRKIELQSSLLEVLESERMVLLTENSRLGNRATSAEEENEGLSAEVAYLRRTAEELSRCVVKLREDHRVCMLGRKIQDLQSQIYALEKRNRECYEVMARREDEKAELVRGVCLELERVKAENKRLREEAMAWAAAAVRRRPKSNPKAAADSQWRARFRAFDWVLCGSHIKTK